MPIDLDPARHTALEAYSRGDMTALELRKRLGGATFGDVLILLGQVGLPLPRAPVEGREAHLARAEKFLFGDDDA